MNIGVITRNAVKRMNRCMLLFSDALLAVAEYAGLFHAVEDFVQSMVHGAAGALMLVDDGGKALWTLAHGQKRRVPITQGILGRCRSPATGIVVRAWAATAQEGCGCIAVASSYFKGTSS